MKVSVIIPVYNVEKYLEKCLQSVINQTYENLEIILIDDCSKDGSLEICKNYLQKDKRIILISQQKNSGQVDSYIKGLEIASGESIVFIDSDDWVDLSMIQKLVEKMESDKADIVVCGCQKVYENKIIYEPQVFDIYKNNYLQEEVISFSGGNFNTNNFIYDFAKFYRCNKLIKKEILLLNLKYVNREIRVFEDNCLVLPSLLDAKKISCVKEYLYFYRQRIGSTMNKFDSEVIETNRKVIKKIDEIYKDRKIIHNINFDILICTLFSLDMILKSDNAKKEKIIYLGEISQDIKNIKYSDCLNYNKKIKITLFLLYFKLNNFILFIYKLYAKKKEWLKKNEK